MALLVFKIIFLVVLVIGVVIMVSAPWIYSEKTNTNEKLRVHKITKLKLIGLIIAGVGLLVVLILGYFN